MDIISGIAAATQAMNLVKEIRSIDRSVDEATFKLKLAELTEALADTKIALSEAREEVAAKNSEIRSLNARIANLSSGESCPICQTGRLKTTSVRPHPVFYNVGVQERQMKCDNPDCAHQEARMHDPTGILEK